MHDVLKLVFWKKKKKKREQEEEGKTIALLLKVATIAAIATALKIASLAFFSLSSNLLVHWIESGD